MMKKDSDEVRQLIENLELAERQSRNGEKGITHKQMMEKLRKLIHSPKKHPLR